MVYKNLNKKATKSKPSKKSSKDKPVIGYVIVTGKTGNIKVKGKTLLKTKSKVGRKIWKSRTKAVLFLRKAIQDNTLEAYRLRLKSPRVVQTLVRDPLILRRLKQAKDYVQR